MILGGCLLLLLVVLLLLRLLLLRLLLQPHLQQQHSRHPKQRPLMPRRPLPLIAPQLRQLLSRRLPLLRRPLPSPPPAAQLQPPHLTHLVITVALGITQAAEIMHGATSPRRTATPAVEKHGWSPILTAFPFTESVLTTYRVVAIPWAMCSATGAGGIASAKSKMFWSREMFDWGWGRK